jgi:ABC-type transporter lipoprotein component MlaA
MIRWRWHRVAADAEQVLAAVQQEWAAHNDPAQAVHNPEAHNPEAVQEWAADNDPAQPEQQHKRYNPLETYNRQRTHKRYNPLETYSRLRTHKRHNPLETYNQRPHRELNRQQDRRVRPAQQGQINLPL